jgi:peptidase S41-like protein
MAMAHLAGGRRRRGLLVPLVLALATASSATAQPSGFDPTPWLADLEQLRDAITARYPNLDWQVRRGLDLPGAYALARGRLETARDSFQARRALERFLAVFADGHLEIIWPAPAAVAASSEPPLCDRLGYFDAGDTGAIATRLPGFEAVGAKDSSIGAGVLTVRGRKVGVLRVPVFEPQGFPRLCERLLAEQRLTPQSPCDDACRDRLAVMGDALLVRAMHDQLAAVVATRPDVLLVDIAGNGGGDDSSIVLARMVAGPDVRKPRAAMMRGEALEKELADRQADVQAGLASAQGPTLAALRRFDAALTAAREAARRSCDRSAVWRGQTPACTGLVAEPVYDGPLPARGSDAVPDWVGVADPLSRFPVASRQWRGPLIVLVDGEAASSSELFAAMLQDAGKAVILGSPTFGTGCGHMTAAGPVTLANSRARVSMPDCVRYRADGRYETAGVQPDVAIGFRRYDTAAERLELTSRALPAAVARALAARP